MRFLRDLFVLLIFLIAFDGLAEESHLRSSIKVESNSNSLILKVGPVSFATIDPASSVFKVYSAGDGGPGSPRTLFLGDYIERASGANVVISGGYMASFSPPRPLGFIKVDGKQIGSPHTSWLGTGMFCTDGQHVKIGPFEELKSDKNFPDCIQSGPLLINDGLVRYDSGEKVSAGEEKLVSSVQEQAFICIDSNNKVILGVSEPIRLDEFSQLLSSKLNCQNALRLTGQRTAGLQTRLKLFGYDEFPLYSVIAVLPKEKSKNSSGAGKKEEVH
jgi:uncharacterized protein YigE (DUF2233 family)